MTRAKTVFSTREIAHLWAHQTQHSGRNPQDNFWWDGTKIYSYRTCIAEIVTVERGPRKGEKVVIMTGRHYSNTTTRHQYLIRMAAPGVVFSTPNIVSNFTDTTPSGVLSDLKSKVAVLEHDLDNPLDSNLKKKRKPTILKEFEALQSAIKRCQEFAEHFGLKYTPPKIKDAEVLISEVKTKAEKELTRRAKVEATRKANWQKHQAEQLAEAQALIPAWRAGNTMGWQDIDLLNSHLPPMLRLNQVQDSGLWIDIVESTRGVNFPVDHALRVLPLVERIIARGEAWQKNGHRIPLGHYQVDSIDADGTVHAGCHHVPKDEILLLIEELKRRYPERIAGQTEMIPSGKEMNDMEAEAEEMLA